MSAPAGTNGAPKKVVPAAPPKPNGKPAPGKPKKDEAIALAAGVVVAGGIAWSLYKSFQGKKEEPELGADIVSGSGQPGEGEPEGGYGSAPPRSLSSSKSYKFKSTKIYEVSKGDTLWSLAGQFNTSVDALKTINGLTSDILVAGETITVPK